MFRIVFFNQKFRYVQNCFLKNVLTANPLKVNFSFIVYKFILCRCGCFLFMHNSIDNHFQLEINIFIYIF
jgi:hypothetical protein